MTTITFDQQAVELEENESVLDALLRTEHAINYGCRSGLCQSCLLEAKEGAVPVQSQKGLSDQQKALGYVMACQCIPSEPMTLNSISSEKLKVSAKVVSKEWLNDQVIRLRLEADMDFLPGQYFTLWKNDQVGRSYSIASLPQDHFIECHIKHYPDGEVSAWVGEALLADQEVALQGPMGSCIYTASSDQPMVMAAMGTGLAPILGLLRQAIDSGHSAPIECLIAAGESKSFYLLDELKALESQHDNLDLRWFSLDAEAEADRDVYSFAKANYTDLAGYKVYLCGGENFVKKMRKTCFLAGAGMQDIVADTFTPFA